MDWLTQGGYVAGYILLFILTFLEGETIVVIAAFLAHRGYFDLPMVIAVSAAGTIFGDQLYYFIGRKRGMSFLDRRPRWREKTRRAEAMIQRHEVLIILIFRFLYGLRIVTPFALGASAVRPRRFVPLNVLSGVVWAAVIAGLGYFLGEMAHKILGKVKQYELYIVVGIAVAGLLVWFFHFLRSRRKLRNSSAEVP